MQLDIVHLVCASLLFLGGCLNNNNNNYPADVEPASSSSYSCNSSQWPVSVLCTVLPHLGWQRFLLLADNLTERVCRRLLTRLMRQGVHARLLVTVDKDLFEDSSDDGAQLRQFGNVIVSCGRASTMQSVLRAASQRNLISLYFNWLLLVPESQSPTDWQQELNDLNIWKPQNLAVIAPTNDKEDDRRGYGIYKMANEPANKELRRSWNEIKHWSKESEDLGEMPTPIYNERLEGSVLKMALIHDPPYTVVLDTPSGGYQLSGLDFEAFDAVATALNFGYQVLRVADNRYGESVNGTWTGMMRPLWTKEADIALPTLTPSLTRRGVVDTSAPVSGGISQFVVRRPTANIDYNTYILPFSPSVWRLLAFGSLLSFASLVLATVTDLGRKHSDRKSNYKEVLFAIVCAATLHSVNDKLPPKASVRIVLATYIVLSTLIAWIYGSVLVAFLTVERNELPFCTLHGLVDNDEYKVGHMDTIAFQDMLAPASGDSSDVFAQLQQKIRSHRSNFVTTNKEGIEKAFREKYAFFTWLDGITSTMGQNCSFMVTGFDVRFDHRYYGIPFAKGSPHLEPITIALMRLKETGVLDYLHRKYIPRFDSFCGSSDDQQQQTSHMTLDMVHVVPIFFVLAGGLTIALLSLLVELLCYHRHNKSSHYIRSLNCARDSNAAT